MPGEVSGEYDEVKSATLQQYDITEKTNQQRLRVANKNEGEIYQELSTWRMDLAKKWTWGCGSVEKLHEFVVT